MLKLSVLPEVNALVELQNRLAKVATSDVLVLGGTAAGLMVRLPNGRAESSTLAEVLARNLRSEVVSAIDRMLAGGDAVLMGLGIDPESALNTNKNVRITAYRQDEEPFRLSRLHSALVTMRAISQAAFNLDCTQQIVRVHDHRGDLTVVWRSENARRKYGAIPRLAWDNENEDPDNVENRLAGEDGYL